MRNSIGLQRERRVGGWDRRKVMLDCCVCLSIGTEKAGRACVELVSVVCEPKQLLWATLVRCSVAEHSRSFYEGPVSMDPKVVN